MFDDCSGPHDHIFVNFVDHGAPGLLAMPSDVLYASQLLTTLQEMNAQNRFAKVKMSNHNFSIASNDSDLTKIDCPLCGGVRVRVHV
jgi:hypothetical protein